MIEKARSPSPPRCIGAGGRPAATPVEEEWEHQFDKLGASTELLESWQYVEQKMLCPAPRGRGLQLGPDERRTTLRFMYGFVELMGMSPQQVWFEAAVLLDTFLKNAPGGTTVGSVPAVAVAIIKILKKLDMAHLDMSQNRFSEHARPLAALLRSLGHTVPDDTEETISATEFLILETLGWRTCVPSVQSWTEKFCARLSAMTAGLPLGPTLEWIWQRSYCNAMTCVVQSSGQQPQRLLAVGFLALGAVEAGLLPMDSVRPDKHEPEAWAELAVRGLFAGREPTCPTTPEGVSRVVRLLEKAMSTSSEEIQDACELVLLTFERSVPARADAAK